MGKFEEILNRDGLVLVDFYATWCGPCRLMTPIIQDVKARVGEQAVILKVDVDKNPALASSLQIQGVPTLILYKNGKPVWRHSGVVPAPQLQQLIEQYAA
jgi:thioredoxin 1